MEHADDQFTEPGREDDDRSRGYGLEPEPEIEADGETSPSDREDDADSSADAEASPSSSDDVGSSADPQPLLRAGSWRPWAGAAAAVLGLVTIAVLAGWSSFFPQVDGRFLDATGKPILDAPEISARFLVATRLVLTTIFIVACAVPALHATAFFESRPVGDLAAGLARLGLGVSIAAAVRLLPLDSSLLQTWVHLGLGLLVLVATAFLLLRLRGPSLTLAMTGWAIAYVLFGLFARLMTWGVPLV